METLEIAEAIETRTAIISLIEPGIVRVRFKPDVELDKKDILENIDASVKLSGGKHCALLEIADNAGITDEALQFAASKENAQYRMANALLFKAASVRLLWNFFNLFFKPTVNNRVFIKEEEAIEWLRCFRYN